MSEVRIYRMCWWAAVLLIGGLGFVVAVLALPAGELLVHVFGGAMVGVGSSFLVTELVRRPRTTSRPASAAVVGSMAMVAAVGVRMLVGEAAVLVLLATVALSSPEVLRCLFAARLRGERARTSNTLAPLVIGSSPLVTAVMVQRLGDEELTAAWHSSCAALQHVADPDQRLGWVVARQAYLDEFERRSPKLFAGWLAANAGAPDCSGQYLPPPLPPGNVAARWRTC